MIEGRKELSNFNLEAIVWLVLYVSIFDLGTGSSLLMDLLLFKGFWIANSTSVTWVLTILVILRTLELPQGYLAANFTCSSHWDQFDSARSCSLWSTISRPGFISWKITEKNFRGKKKLLRSAFSGWFLRGHQFQC